MGGYGDKVQKSAAGVLRPGERVISAIRTQPSGTVIATGVVWTVARNRSAVTLISSKTAPSPCGSDAACALASGGMSAARIAADSAFECK